DAGAKTVAVSETSRGVIREAGGAHREFAHTRLDAQEMLPHPADLRAGECHEPLPLRGEPGRHVHRFEAAVQSDLVSCLCNGAKNAARGARLRMIREVTRAYAPNRRR